MLSRAVFILKLFYVSSIYVSSSKNLPQRDETPERNNKCNHCEELRETGTSPFNILWTLKQNIGPELSSEVLLDKMLLNTENIKMAEALFLEYCTLFCGTFPKSINTDEDLKKKLHFDSLKEKEKFINLAKIEFQKASTTTGNLDPANYNSNNSERTSHKVVMRSVPQPQLHNSHLNDNATAADNLKSLTNLQASTSPNNETTPSAQYAVSVVTLAPEVISTTGAATIAQAPTSTTLVTETTKVTPTTGAPTTQTSTSTIRVTETTKVTPTTGAATTQTSTSTIRVTETTKVTPTTGAATITQVPPFTELVAETTKPPTKITTTLVTSKTTAEVATTTIKSKQPTTENNEKITSEDNFDYIEFEDLLKKLEEMTSDENSAEFMNNTLIIITKFFTCLMDVVLTDIEFTVDLPSGLILREECTLSSSAPKFFSALMEYFASVPIYKFPETKYYDFLPETDILYDVYDLFVESRSASESSGIFKKEDTSTPANSANTLKDNFLWRIFMSIKDKMRKREATEQ